MKWLDLIFTPDVVSKVEAGLIVALILGAYEYVRSKIRSRQLIKRFEEDHYTSAEIKKRAISNRATYVRPDCQDNNPADSGLSINRKPIFQAIDWLLGSDQPARLTLILGDTGMGKSTFLERYYEYHWSSPGKSKRFKPIVISLNGLDANELIDRIGPQACGETVLLLDALDEDKTAIEDFANRLNDLVELAGKFHAIVVTCRTQFLTGTSFVPEEIKLEPPSGPMSLAGGPNRRVNRLFLSPFSDAQVKKYLIARFPYWRHPIFRTRAQRTAERFKDLMSRPLLLTFIQELASTSEKPKYSFQVYKVIVESWLEREKNKNRLTFTPENLIRFSEEFAASLFAIGRDRMPVAELQSMAERYGVGPLLRDVRERSLLHNDAEGNWKFAHRTIMEYLVVVATSNLKNRPDWCGQPWTYQMLSFAREMLVSGECKRMPWADLNGLNLKRVDLSDVELSGANLSGADLSDSHLSGANLSKTDLSDANLTEATLTNANLDFANLRGACLERTVLRGVDLGKASGITQLQAATAITDQATIWPEWIPMEASLYYSHLISWSSRIAERNAELLAQQRLRRYGVRTPEFKFPKHFDNSRLIRTPDPVRVREIRLFSAAVTVLFTLTMLDALQHFYAIELGYRIELEKQQLNELHEENIELRLVEAKLKGRLRLKFEEPPNQPAVNINHPPQKTPYGVPPLIKP